jgi:SET domain-containing protein
MFFIEIKKTPGMGNGVFAARDFAVGDIIEICPVVTVKSKQNSHAEETDLIYWLFEWEHPDESAMLFGYGMIYNHSVDPNASYSLDFGPSTVTFKAIKPIKSGEEIFIDYNTYTGPKHLEMLHPETKKSFTLPDHRLKNPTV